MPTHDLHDSIYRWYTDPLYLPEDAQHKEAMALFMLKYLGAQSDPTSYVFPMKYEAPPPLGILDRILLGEVPCL